MNEIVASSVILFKTKFNLSSLDKANFCSADGSNKTIKSKRIWKTSVITLRIVIHDDDNDLTHFNLKQEAWSLFLNHLPGESEKMWGVWRTVTSHLAFNQPIVVN